jgi:type II secretory pathway pseudopilin PulG
MLRKLCSAPSSKPSPAGFTLVEILVGLTIASAVIIGVGTGVVFATRAWADTQARLQAQQSLRSASENLSRETRLAGACMLPYSTGAAPPANFQPLGGTHGTTDTITITSNPACAKAATTAACNNCTAIAVDNPANFVAGGWAYLLNTSASLNQYFKVASVSGSTLNVAGSPAPPISGNYPTGTSVFGVDQRTFSISTSCTGCGGVPTLVLQTLNIGTATPVTKGVDALSIQYVLNRAYNNTTCNAATGGTPNLCVVTLPTTSPSVAGDWQLVRDALFTIDARSAVKVRAAGSADGFFHLSATLKITPRNFVFVQGGRL